MDKRTFVLAHDQARKNALSCIQSAPPGYCVTVSEPTRNLEQNALLWSILGELAAQVDWHGQKLSADDWKNVLSSSLKKQRVVPGIDGGFVVMGQSTSRMSKAEFSELCELALAFGAQHGVNFGGDHAEK
jgi:hypothetical protein